MKHPSVLIFGGCHVRTVEERDIVKLWARVVRHVNPDIDVLLMNSVSPFDPVHFVPKNLKIELYNYKTNPGHLSRGGGDGAGRTFCDGIKIAHERGYDYAVHWETDLLFARPVKDWVARMDKAGVKIAVTPCMFYQFLEWGLAFMNVKHMIDSKWIEKYDWEHAPLDRIPEWRSEDCSGDDLFTLPLRGLRNSQNWANPKTLEGLFPYHPPDYITHSDMSTLHRFLDLNHIELPK